MRKIKYKPKVVRHFLGPFNHKTQTQSCITCGKVIHNYSNSFSSPNNEDGSTYRNNGWQPGEHYVQGINPTVFSSIAPDNKEYNIVICKINKS